jgi:hypothetical protein
VIGRAADQQIGTLRVGDAGLSVLVCALLGLGLGVLLRSAVGAIVIFCLLWYILPIVALNLPEPWHDRLGSLMLNGLPDQLAHTNLSRPSVGIEYLLSPLGALVAMAAYALVPLGGAAVVIRCRDA